MYFYHFCKKSTASVLARSCCMEHFHTSSIAIKISLNPNATGTFSLLAYVAVLVTCEKYRKILH